MNSLSEYNAKRNFENTPEPEGTNGECDEKNRFVVQRHMARREHYDFRLQVEDALVSWAIPKKPVNDTEVKRLAIKVEDHPLSYIHFEGNIPKGNYGAGTVMVWDVGYYYLDMEKILPTPGEMKKRLAKGKLKLYLRGARLNGFFNLVKSSNSDKDEWFFMKAPDKEKGAEDEERSALTGRTMEEISGRDEVWNSDEAKTEIIAKPDEIPAANNDNTSTEKAEKKNFPGFIKPMLATLSGEPFSKEGWIFEIKFDGYRVIAAKEEKKVDLYSRNNNSFADRYALIAKELSEINAGFVIDGEVCFMENPEQMDFQKLQNKENEQEKLHYYVFDLLWLNGHDLKNLPLTERKKLLQLLLKNPPPHIHYVSHVETKGTEFFAEVEKKQLEGMIAKRADGKYHTGIRSENWLKIKTGYRQEMIICGYTLSDKESRAFSSLICAVNEDDDLIYTGRVGTGFSDSHQKKLMAQLKKLGVKKAPVVNPPNFKNIHWVKPELICEVKFSSWTNDKIMRHPSFIGLRSDKKPQEIVIEKPVSPEETESKVTFTNLTKVFWPEEGYTKGDVIAYYRDISSFILPYLKNRPQSLYRTPNGMEGKGFFQKNMDGKAPEWAETVKVDNSNGGYIEYLLCQEADTLLYMANLGCIEINPWSSSLPKLDNPDYMVFDLDPVEVDFAKVLQIALAFKKLFDQLSISAYCKTSGSRGLHIYVPVEQKYTYPQVQNFVKIMEHHIHNQFKDITSFERSPSKRKGKIYLDYLQNAKGKTMSSVYSLRPRPGAPVSAPVRWEELTEGLTPVQFNLKNIHKRLEKEGDLWEGIFENRVDMGKVLQAMGSK
jgi:bifunctional non-homologous end joining protein LigD